MKFKKLAAAVCAAALSLTVMSVTAFAAEEDPGIALTKENFPESLFLARLRTGYDKNSDEHLSESEIADITKLEFNESYIVNLEGIEYLTALEELTVTKCQYIKDLDLSKNTKLETLTCTNNPKLEKLNVSGCSALEKLYCSNNQLKELDIIANTALVYLDCERNALTELNVSKNTKLEKLYVSGNQIGELDVQNNPELDLLSLDNCGLTSLDVSKNTKLKNLSVPDNKLTTLNVSANTALEILDCHYNKLTELDISNNPNILKAYNEGKATDNETSNGTYTSYGYSILYTLYVDKGINIITEAQNTDTSTDPVSDVSETESSSAVDSKPSDNNKPTGAATGLAFAGIALAGAALAVSKKRK